MKRIRRKLIESSTGVAGSDKADDGRRARSVAARAEILRRNGDDALREIADSMKATEATKRKKYPTLPYRKSPAGFLTTQEIHEKTGLSMRDVRSLANRGRLKATCRN